MSESILPPDIFQQAFQGFEKGIELVIEAFVFALVGAVKYMWQLYWLYITIFFVVLIAGMITQILMLRGGRHNKLSAGFNSLVGGVFYLIFLVLITAVAYLIFGYEVIDKEWIGLFGVMAFGINWLFLRAIGFWYY